MAAAQVPKSMIAGPSGAIEIAAHSPQGSPRAIAIVAHPHPLFGGSMDNKVVTSVARAFVDSGATTWRFNFRGVGGTEGAHDEGRGETDDMLAVIAHARATRPGLPLWMAGFSFGGAVALAAAARTAPEELILVAPSLKRLAQWQQAGNDESHPANTLVIHGERDDTVPLTDSLDWARPREIPVTVVPGADHFFHQRLHLIRLIVSRWLPAPL